MQDSLVTVRHPGPHHVITVVLFTLSSWSWRSSPCSRAAYPHGDVAVVRRADQGRPLRQHRQRHQRMSGSRCRVRVVTARNASLHNVLLQCGGRLPGGQQLHGAHQRRVRPRHPVHRAPRTGCPPGHRRRQGGRPHAVDRRAGGVLLVPEPVLPAHPTPHAAIQRLPAGPGVGVQATQPAGDPAECRGGRRRRGPARDRRRHRLRGRCRPSLQRPGRAGYSATICCASW